MESADEELNTAISDIIDVKHLCRTNFAGHWELAWLPYSGGLYEQPADDMERILMIIGIMNKMISDKQSEKS